MQEAILYGFAGLTAIYPFDWQIATTETRPD